MAVLLPPSIEQLRTLMARAYIGAPGAGLRREDEKKCQELAGLLAEILALLRRVRHREGPLHVVDAAAGKGYVGLSVLALVAPALSRPVRLTFLEREENRAEAIRTACQALGSEAHAAVFAGNVADASLWPSEPDLVVALHACGDASDRIIERSVSVAARHVFLVPCCVAAGLPAARRAKELAESSGLPRQAEIRRRHLEAHVLSDRVLTLESAGWETQAVPFVPPTVTPYNVLLRARRVREPNRMTDAIQRLARLRGLQRTA